MMPKAAKLWEEWKAPSELIFTQEVGGEPTLIRESSQNLN